MISSLQQLHSAARRTRNFVSNFQVASQERHAGAFSAWSEASTSPAKVRKTSTQFVSRTCTVGPLNELKRQKKRQRRKTPLRIVWHPKARGRQEERWVASVVLIMCGVLFVLQGAYTQHLSTVWGQSTSLCCVKVQSGASAQSVPVFSFF